MKLVIVCILLILFISTSYSISYSQDAGHDVLLEKLISIQKDVNDLKISVDNTTVKRETQLNEMNKEIIVIKLEQSTQSAKINIIWGIFGTIAGGGGVVLGTYTKKRKEKE